jgi:hypothetical protein
MNDSSLPLMPQIWEPRVLKEDHMFCGIEDHQDFIQLFQFFFYNQ